MTTLEIISLLNEKTKEFEIPFFGIVKPKPIPKIREYKKISSLGYFKNLKYLEKVDLREEPEKFLKGLKSILAFPFPYNFSSREILSKKPKEEKIASFAMKGDYHLEIKEKLKEIAKIFSGNNKVICDTSPFLEKPYGEKAGLGFMGKNTLLINEKFGSAFNLGFILTDLDLPEKKLNFKGSCRGCKRCIEICPTGALEKPYILNPSKCISYLTIEAKEIEEKDLIRWGYIYGCDLCQAVCPYNLKLEKDRVTSNFTFERISKERLKKNREVIKEEKIDFYIKQEGKYFPLNPKLKNKIKKILSKEEKISFDGKDFKNISKEKKLYLKKFFSKIQTIDKEKPFEIKSYFNMLK